MRRSARVVGLVLCAIVLAACAGPLRGMKDVAGPVESAPSPGKATVVFMRPSTLGSGIASSVFEMRAPDDLFIGHVPAKKNNTRRACRTRRSSI